MTSFISARFSSTDTNRRVQVDMLAWQGKFFFFLNGVAMDTFTPNKSSWSEFGLAIVAAAQRRAVDSQRSSFIWRVNPGADYSSKDSGSKALQAQTLTEKNPSEKPPGCNGSAVAMETPRGPAGNASTLQTDQYCVSDVTERISELTEL